MPFSNLNLEAIIANNDIRLNQIKYQLFKFRQFLTQETDLFGQVELIDCKHLFVVKIRMSAEFEFREVELSFKLYFMKSFTFSEELISFYLKKFSNLKPIYFLTKSVLHKNNLDKLSTGGINSFSLVLLIVSFLQQKEFEKDEEKRFKNPEIYKDAIFANKSSNGGVVAIEQSFAEFLYFFGYLFDFMNYELQPFGSSKILRSPIVKVF